MENFDMELVLTFCDEAIDSLPRWESICLELNKAPSKELFEELFRHAHNLKGGSRAVGLMPFGEFVHKVEDGITLLRDAKVPWGAKYCDLLLEAHGILSAWITALRANPLAASPARDFVAKYGAAFDPSAVLPSASAPVTEATVAAAIPVSVAFASAEAAAPAPPPVVGTPAAPAKARTGNANESLRISTLKLDHLLQVIGELSIHQSILWHSKAEIQNGSKLYLNSLQLSQKLTKEIYDSALSLRMQPIQSVFQRLERNVLDLSRSLEKQVQVTLQGGDVELDKTVIEKIVDPLMHIVRNAIDHGIELPAVRELAGKSSSGALLIEARQDAFGIELVIRDDGKGLAAERIRKKAIEKGLLAPDAQLSAKETAQLIFLPGFSTAEKVTDVSGRGVGMDVVKRSLEDLKGSIEIESEEGKGTSFRITLPTSVSIIEGLLVRVAGEKYVVPVDSVMEVIELDSAVTPESRDMLLHNGQVLATYELAPLLTGGRPRTAGVPAAHPGTQAEGESLLVCRRGTKQLGLRIERVLGQQPVVIRPLNANIAGSFGLLGGTILGNGEPGLIIDVGAIAQRILESAQPSGLPQNLEQAS